MEIRFRLSDAATGIAYRVSHTEYHGAIRKLIAPYLNKDKRRVGRAKRNPPVVAQRLSHNGCRTTV